MPRRVTEVKSTGGGWLRFLRGFIATEQGRVEVGAIEHRDEIVALIDEVRRKGK